MIPLLKNVVDAITKLFNGFLPVLPFMAPFAVLLGLFDWLNTNYSTITTAIDALASSVQGTPSTTYLAQANRILPLSEALGMLAVLFALRVAAFIFRFVKSWIPTVN